MTIELFYDSDCPLADGVRKDLHAVLAEAGSERAVAEHVDAGRLSPTLLVDGDDVAGDQPPGSGCRLTRPTRDQIRSALSRGDRG